MLSLSGDMHTLQSLIVITIERFIVWSYIDIAQVWFRILSPEFVERYFEVVGNEVTTSVVAMK